MKSMKYLFVAGHPDYSGHVVFGPSKFKKGAVTLRVADWDEDDVKNNRLVGLDEEQRSLRVLVSKVEEIGDVFLHGKLDGKKVVFRLRRDDEV